MTQRKVRGSLPATVGVLCFADIIASLETSMLYTALPTIGRETGDLVQAGWLITGYLLVMACSAAVGGRLGDLYGRKRVLMITLALCSLGSLISAFAPTMGGVIAGRALQGVAGTVLPLCFGILRERAGAKASLWIGVLSGAYAVAGALGYILGGLLTDHFHWRALFYVTAMAPIIALGLAWLFLSETARGKPVRLDIVGGILFAPAIAGLLFGLGRGPSTAWAAASLGPIAGGIALLLFWVWWELRQPEPLIEVRLLGNRQIMLANLIYLSAGLGAVQLSLLMLMILQQPAATGVGLGMSAVAAALWKLPTNIASGTAAPLAGWSAGHFGARIGAIVGALAQVAAWTWLYFRHDSLPELIVGMMLASFSAGTLLAAVPNLIVEVVPPERTSEATGMSSVVRAIGSAIGTAIVALILSSGEVHLPDGSGPFPSAGAIELALAFVLATTAAGLALALLLPRTIRSISERPSRNGAASTG